MNVISETVLDLAEVIQKIDIWKSEDGDRCVTVTRDPGARSDRHHYVSVLDTRTGPLLDELEF